MNAIALLPTAVTALPPDSAVHRLRIPFASVRQAAIRWLCTELRIDVDHTDEGIERELDGLYERRQTPGDPIHCGTPLPIPGPGLHFRHREADGEHFVYVEDVARRRLAGYTVFNRLIEVDRRTDRHIRSPHSKYAVAYRGRGIASAIYDWALGRGFCLVSGARQSESAHALWQSLARRHRLRWIALRDKRMHDLGPDLAPHRADSLDTRMLLLGAGWSLAELRDRGLLCATAERREGNSPRGLPVDPPD